jgi:hypothetical protein
MERQLERNDFRLIHIFHLSSPDLFHCCPVKGVK